MVVDLKISLNDNAIKKQEYDMEWFKYDAINHTFTCKLVGEPEVRMWQSSAVKYIKCNGRKITDDD